MAYVPGQASQSSSNAAAIAALKQSNVSSYATVSASTSAVLGTFYDVTGAAAVTVTLPAAPASGQGVVTVKVDAAYTGGGVTVAGGSGQTVDGSASFTGLTTPGTEYTFFINAGSTDYKIG